MSPVEPSEVHATLGRHLIASGLPLVLDLGRSRGVLLHDALSGTDYLDFAGFYASNALGFGHPALETPAAREQLLESARIKVGNPEFYTVAFAEFVKTVERVAAPATHPHYFFVEGGALAVENAMKAAMDWKVRHNLARGKGEIGTEILHFERAFHGRAGYTLSVTNTDPAKTQYFPKFDWPRVPSPALSFPRDASSEEAVIAAEQACLDRIDRAFEERRDRIAAILIEPLQGEGGDNQFRPEFLQALRRVADEREALLIFDEVQSGVGITGRFWAHEHAGVQPDLLCFAKKMQVGGFFASRRIDDVDNVFKVPSRISSTWGGALVDMVRSTHVLGAVEREGLVANAAARGLELRQGLEHLAEKRSRMLSSARGLGLMCAIDLPSTEERNELVKRCMAERLLVLAGGTRTVRFRPALTVTAEDVHEALRRFARAVDPGS